MESIALACILKNELKNIPRLLASVEGCFDEIHLTDTGSNDGSLELIEGYIRDGKNPANTKIFLHHFTWCDDFSAARNYSFSHPQTDYIMWMDLDDVLSSKEAFRRWRDTALELADFWLNTYHYSLSQEGKPLCSFARERVIKRSLGLKWTYFVHEGILPSIQGLNVSYAQTWSINHLRDAEDLKADRSRNLSLFDKHPVKDARMTYYYGKELFENQKPLEAFGELMKAASVPPNELQIHDRVMALQYACLAAMALNQMEKAISLAHQGLQLSPERAEFFIVIADSYVKLGKVREASVYYASASACQFQGSAGIQGAIFAHEDSYGNYPLTQLSKIMANSEKFDEAEEYAKKAMKFGSSPELEAILKGVDNIRAHLAVPKDKRRDTTDIVISCPPAGLYEWDWNVYQQKGIGGSETAAVEMARWLSELTKRKVIVFAPRQTTSLYGNVEYRPAGEAFTYFKECTPALHIAWRHCTKFNDDPFYVWCHDLAVPGVDKLPANAKILALSDFHKGFLEGLYGVPANKIIVTANGVDPQRFTGLKEKEVGKVVWSSSPDRGLDRAILVMDEVIKLIPEAKLHIYYGFDNMEKMGHLEQVKNLKEMIAKRPHLVYHGNLPQKDLTKELSSACVWLYPTTFLETYCITAIEMLSSGVYPVVRSWGALKNTLAMAEGEGMAKLVKSDCANDKQVCLYAAEVVDAIKNKAWERVDVDPSHYSWESVARSWMELFHLEERCLKLSSL